MKLEFDEVEVPPGAGITVLRKGPEDGFAFRGTSIHATESVPGTLRLIALFVGNRFQFPDPNAQGIPMVTFSGAFSEVLLDTCRSGLLITAWVQNDSDKPVKLAFSIDGRTAKEQESA